MSAIEGTIDQRRQPGMKRTCVRSPDRFQITNIAQGPVMVAVWPSPDRGIRTPKAATTAIGTVASGAWQRAGLSNLRRHRRRRLFHRASLPRLVSAAVIKGGNTNGTKQMFGQDQEYAGGL